MTRILLVEDEKNLSKLIKLNLELEGYEVDLAEDGESALNCIDSAYYDLMILDLMLPKIPGMDVLSSVRLKLPNLPVIIISAKDTSTDRIEGLKKGADDYLTKPFDIEELTLRMLNLLSRKGVEASRPQNEVYKFGTNSIDFSSLTASNGQKEWQLSPKEAMIMKYLIANKNKVVSRQDLLKHVWGYDVFPTTRTVDNFISVLRKFFETDLKQPKFIISIRGVGYKFIE